MKILVTGSHGQLGSELLLALQADCVSCVGVGREDIDFARPGEVADAVAAHAARWVVNCAAYSHVDNAERESELAFTVNRDAARAVAEGARLGGGRVLHVSTDFVFGGDQVRPYREEDPCHPLSVYGRSKLAGEQAVREVMPDALILRTAWVYGEHGRNFVKTILRLAATQSRLRVVDDQLGTPSWTADIVTAIRRLLDADVGGTWHFTNEGVASWYDFACEIVTYARHKGLPVVATGVEPIPSKELPRPAERPPYSVMSKEKIRGVLGYPIPHWRDSLHTMLDRLATGSSQYVTHV